MDIDIENITSQQAEQIIRSIDLEEYKKFVLEYNKSILTRIQSKEYPTNDEILESGILIKNRKK